MTTISKSTRGYIHIASLLTALFLGVYAKLVCQFIDSVPVYEIVQNIAGIALFQIIAREALFKWYLSKKEIVLVPRAGYYSSIILWAVSGAVAVAIHHYRYADFPFGSHLKMLSGYWILGSGILAQWELVILEKEVRAANRNRGVIQQFPERFARRIMQGFVLFTTLPMLGILILITRYVMEDTVSIDVAFEILYLVLFYAGVALIVAWYYGKGLAEDTEVIVAEVQKIADGNFDTIIDSSRPDELGKVAAGIQDMAKGLQLRERIKDAFGRFVSPHVAQEFIKNYSQKDKEAELGGTRKKVCILYADIRNFTPLAEELEPEELTSLLNGYFSRMVESIKQHNGVVDKFIGDAIMAVFGLVESDENTEVQAVKAAKDMRTQLNLFNHIQERRNGRTIENGIGIHCGEVIAGYFGSKDRLEFTVVGSVVNLAARIEAECKTPNPPVLLSRAVKNEIDGIIEVRSVGMFEMKGVREPEELFTIT